MEDDLNNKDENTKTRGSGEEHEVQGKNTVIQEKSTYGIDDNREKPISPNNNNTNILLLKRGTHHREKVSTRHTYFYDFLQTC